MNPTISSEQSLRGDDLATPEEVLTRSRRRRLKWAVAIISLLAVGAYFLLPQAGRLVKGWHSRRLAHESLALADHEQWKEANQKARDAYELRSTEPEAWRALGRVLSRDGQPAMAITLWQKVEQAGRLTLEDRYDYAISALGVRNLVAARTQIASLLARPGGPAPGDVLLSAQLAAQEQQTETAVSQASRVLADKRAKPRERLSASLQLISVSTPDAPAYRIGYGGIQSLADDPASALSLDALTFLARLSPPLPLGQPAIAGETLPPINVADALDSHPRAQPTQHLLALELRARHDPTNAEHYITQAMERFQHGDDATLAALVIFLQRLGRQELVLQVLPPEKIQRSQELFLKRLDALAALGRWTEVRSSLDSPQFPLDPVLQQMYQATAYTHLGEQLGAVNHWNQALNLAKGDGGKFAMIGQYAQRNGALETADAAYSAAIAAMPHLHTAYVARLQLAAATGKTDRAHDTLVAMLREWPDDVAAKDDESYLRLLLGARGPEVAAIEQSAAALAAHEPESGSVRATLALARLRLHQAQAALAAFDKLPLTDSARPVPPGVRAVLAATHAANGENALAKAEARTIADAKMWPEERALLEPLLSLRD